MTDDAAPTGPQQSDDELVSAALDDEATPTEHAAIAADRRLSARLESFRQVRDEHRRIATDDAAPLATGADDRIAAALAAGADPAVMSMEPGSMEATSTEPPVEVAPPTDLAPRRSTPRWATFVGAAAAVVVVLAGIGLLTRGGTTDSDSTASGAADSAESADLATPPAERRQDAEAPSTAPASTTAPAFDGAEAAPSNAENDTAAIDSGSATSTAWSTEQRDSFTSTLPSLGAHPSLAELIATMGVDAIGAWPAVDAASLPCVTPAGPTVGAATATIDGVTAIVIDDGGRVVAFDPITCRQFS